MSGPSPLLGSSLRLASSASFHKRCGAAVSLARGFAVISAIAKLHSKREELRSYNVARVGLTKS